MDTGRRILYIGGFSLPDKNAAAHRVLANAKALREIGNEVIFLNVQPCEKAEDMTVVDCHGFRCYLHRKSSQVKYLLGYSTVKAICEKESITDIIAYNYPAVALKRIRNYTKRKGIRCYADATEWYVSSKGRIFKFIKGIDTWYRMEKVHFTMDGLIAISEYLYQYYQNRIPTIKVPPLTDIREAKWIDPKKEDPETMQLCYAGSPTLVKERLDVIVNTVVGLSKSIKVKLLIAGITESEYQARCPQYTSQESVVFLGRLSHPEVIQLTSSSDWTIIIRDNNLPVRAGFPTKVAESITCGIPVIANRFSNITEYLDDSNSIIIEDMSELGDAIQKAYTIKTNIDRTLFDYHRYLSFFQEMFH